MRPLTRETFNTPATESEIREALAVMDSQRHVNREIVRDYLNPDSRNPYQLTLGKLRGLSATSLYVDATTLARQLGVQVEHPIRPEARRVN
jgi:hypothetical protein